MYQPPAANKILILAPHPDDEALGCGGTIALYASNGADVHLIVISDGGKILEEFTEGIDIVEIRKKEAIEASKILGIKKTYFLDFPDGRVCSYSGEIREKIKDIVLEFKPDIIFSPSLVDYHADHMAVSEVALWLLNTTGVKVAFYDVYGALRFNCLVDISEVLHVKEKVLLNYYYSLFQLPDLFYEAIKGLNRFKAIYTRQNRYYETFYLVDKPADKNSLLQWYVYDKLDIEPAEFFLSKLRVTDELIYELQRSYNAIREKEAIINDLLQQLDNKDRMIMELKASLDNINRTLMWKLANSFYRCRDGLLPKNSKRRKVYNIIVSSLKSIIR